MCNSTYIFVLNELDPPIFITLFKLHKTFQRVPMVLFLLFIKIKIASLEK